MFLIYCFKCVLALLANIIIPKRSNQTHLLHLKKISLECQKIQNEHILPSHFCHHLFYHQ